MPTFTETPTPKRKQPTEKDTIKKPLFPDCDEDVFAQKYIQALDELYKEKKRENPNYPLPKD